MHRGASAESPSGALEVLKADEIAGKDPASATPQSTVLA
jgi:hypothetical protein